MNLVALSELKGDKGEQAETPNLSFTAVQVAAGSQPTAQVSGVYPNLQVELGLPAGNNAEAPKLTFRTKSLNPGEQPTAQVSGVYPNLQIELGLPSGKNAESPVVTCAAESLPAGEQPKVEMSGSYPNLQLAFKLPRGERGLQGKSLIVLPNGHYGQWDEAQKQYVDSGVEAAATIDIDNVNVTFSESESRVQIETGESIPTLFGKIRKWFSELKELAFKDKVDYNTDIDNLPSLITLHDVQNEVNTHNDVGNAHTDIRGLITALTASALTAARVKQGAGIQVETQGNGDVKISCTIDNDLFVVVQSLPQTGIANRLYLVPKSSPEGQNIHDEYLYIDGKWEQVGTVSVDLGNYYTKVEANNKINELIEAHNASGDAHAGMFVDIPFAVLLAASWVAHEGGFKSVFYITGMKNSSTAWVSPVQASEDDWVAAGIRMLGKTTQGALEIYSRSKPAKNITVSITYKK